MNDPDFKSVIISMWIALVARQTMLHKFYYEIVI